MSTRRVRAAAWTIWAVSMLLATGGLVLLFASFGIEIPDSWGFRGFTFIFAATFGTLGALLVAARRSFIGWLLLVAGLLSGIQNFAEEYAIYGIIAWPGSLPAANYLGWVNSWIWVVIIGLVGVFVPLLFPDGRFLSSRWRIVGVAAVAFGLFLATGLSLAEGPLNNAPFITNPLGISGIQSIDAVTGTPRPAFFVGYGGMAACALAALISVVIRFRAARGVERQQMKFLAFGGGIMVLGFILGAGLQQQGKLGQIFFILSLQIVPISVGIAVLRYRLYDIDVLINRAVVYGLTSAAIAASFFILIVVLQTPLRSVTGGSELAVAGSTLLCFALFQPVRRRIQASVDRSFYRSRYDAGRTLDAFTSRLAGEVDLDAVGAELTDAVTATVRPAHVSLWLRRDAP